MLLSASFTAKFALVFVLTLENAFQMKRLHFKTNRKSRDFSKSSTRNFRNSPSCVRSACFYLTISGNFETKTFFKKLEYSFLIESTEIESASFPYTTAISEANVKTNTMVSTKCTYHKERSFARKPFFFLKIFFQFKNLL